MNTTPTLPKDWPQQLRKLLLAKYGGWIRSLGWSVDDTYQDVALRILVAQQRCPYDPAKSRLSTYLLWQSRNAIINRLALKRPKLSRCTEEHLEDVCPTTAPEENLEHDLIRHLYTVLDPNDPLGSIARYELEQYDSGSTDTVDPNGCLAPYVADYLRFGK